MPSTPCPICGKPPAAKFTPFCSERCQQRDLANWLDGRYAIPAEEDPEDAAAPGAPEEED